MQSLYHDKATKARAAMNEPASVRAVTISEALSAERLGPYLLACSGEERAALCLYAWNVQISGAFYGLLGCLEVVMRNAIDRELVANFRRRDWWFARDLYLKHDHRRRVEEARQSLERRRSDPTSGAMISELPFSFWVSLLGAGLDYETRLWRPALRMAFPHYQGRRKPIHRRFNHLRLFRNRIAHHKPIFRQHLEADHRTILELLSFVEPDLVAWVSRHDRVPDVLSARDAICSGQRQARF